MSSNAQQVVGAWQSIKIYVSSIVLQHNEASDMTLPMLATSAKHLWVPISVAV